MRKSDIPHRRNSIIVMLCRRLYPVCLLSLSLPPSSSLFSAARTGLEDADVVLMTAIVRVRLQAPRNTNNSSTGVFAYERAPDPIHFEYKNLK